MVGLLWLLQIFDFILFYFILFYLYYIIKNSYIIYKHCDCDGWIGRNISGAS